MPLGEAPPGRGRGTQAAALAAALTAIGLAAGAAAADPIVFTDRDEYSVGDTVVVVGAGWLRGEAVSLTFYGSPVQHKARAIKLVADSRGEIYDKAYVVDEHDHGTAVTLVARGGSSGLDAITTFTVVGAELSKSTWTGPATGPSPSRPAAADLQPPAMPPAPAAATTLSRGPRRSRRFAFPRPDSRA